MADFHSTPNLILAHTVTKSGVLIGWLREYDIIGPKTADLWRNWLSQMSINWSSDWCLIGRQKRLKRNRFLQKQLLNMITFKNKQNSFIKKANIIFVCSRTALLFFFRINDFIILRFFPRHNQHAFVDKIKHSFRTRLIPYPYGNSTSFIFLVLNFCSSELIRTASLKRFKAEHTIRVLLWNNERYIYPCKPTSS